LNKGKKIILLLLVSAILFSISSCGRKTPLFLKDRAGSSGMADFSKGDGNKNE